MKAFRERRLAHLGKLVSIEPIEQGKLAEHFSPPFVIFIKNEIKSAAQRYLAAD